MRFLKNTLLWSLLVGTLMSANAQQEKQPKLLQLGAKARKDLQYAHAITYYLQYLQNTRKVDAQNKVMAQTALADCFWKMRNYTAADYWYRQLPASAKDALTNYRGAELLARQKNYSAAAELLNGMQQYSEKRKGYLNTNALVKDSADWTISYLNINTPDYREFSPLVAGQSLIWSTNEPTLRNKEGVLGWDGNSYSKMVLYKDQKEAGAESIPEIMPYDSALAAVGKQKALAIHYTNSDVSLLYQPLFLTDKLQAKRKTEKNRIVLGGLEEYRFNQAHASLHAASNTLFLSINAQEKKLKHMRRVGIAQAKLDGDHVQGLQFSSLNNADYSLMHPAIHPNGTLLVFASEQPGGKGGFDLYLSQKINDSTWSAPLALQELNTNGDEVFPSFNSNGDLIYSSDGLAGLGGLDLYESAAPEFKKLYHLPSPVNSSADDFGYTANEDGKTGYFTSDRYGSDDIFRFTYAPIQIQLKGNVISRNTKKGVAGVTIRLIKKMKREDGTEDWEKVEDVLTNGDGNYELHGRPNSEYKIIMLYPHEDDEKDVSTENNFKNQEVGTFYVDQEPIIIVDPEPKNFIIHFDFDKSVLMPESISILDEAIQLLKSNESLLIWLDAHTDFEGMDGYNISLSQQRLEKSVNYLINAGISKERIIGKYYGESNPVEFSKKWKDLWKNRRVEIRIWK